jgi:hypothetical protein
MIYYISVTRQLALGANVMTRPLTFAAALDAAIRAQKATAAANGQTLNAFTGEGGSQRSGKYRALQNTHRQWRICKDVRAPENNESRAG